MKFLEDPKTDEIIRAALKKADDDNSLGAVAQILQIAGGENELRKIINSTGELPIVDRGMIGMHLGLS